MKQEKSASNLLDNFQQMDPGTSEKKTKKSQKREGKLQRLIITHIMKERKRWRQNKIIFANVFDYKFKQYLNAKYL